MPVIRINDATWDRLKRWAIPLEDSPEDAVRKVLDAAEDHLRCRPHGPNSKQNSKQKVELRKNHRLPRGEKTPQHAYYRPILEALYELGGRAPIGKVLGLVEPRMKLLLVEHDYQKVASGVIRWENTAAWARSDLVKKGLLKSDSPHGVWELSADGVRKIEESK